MTIGSDDGWDSFLAMISAHQIRTLLQISRCFAASCCLIGQLVTLF